MHHTSLHLLPCHLVCGYASIVVFVVTIQELMNNVVDEDILDGHVVVNIDCEGRSREKQRRLH